MNIKTKLRGIFASALLALAVATPTQSFAITNVIYLAMDGSGSIDDSDWNLQVDGYVSALSTVIDSSFYGNVAIGVSIFGANVVEIHSLSTINNAADLTALTTTIFNTRIGGIGADRGGVSTFATAAGDAINMAAAEINNFGLGTNNVIDVSTDGFSNTGADAATAATNALPNITTNCLGIGPGANCNFETGFEVLAPNFAAFESALTSKLKKELNVPEPAITALLAMGLVGIGLTRRRKI